MEPSEIQPIARSGDVASGSRAAETELSPRTARTLAVGYTCNNQCCMCLVEGLRGTRPPMDWNTYRRHVDAAAADPRVDRLVLSGAESTLEPDFLRRAEYTRDSGGFRHIRVQSNGRRFADAKFTRAAREAGIDEFYISVRAHDAALDASITGRDKNFPELLAGLENIRAAGGTLLTCTAVFERNVHHLTAIAELVLGFEPARVEFYNFVPVSPQQQPLLAPLAAIEPALQGALDRVAARRTEAAATWFPRCILGPHDNAFVPDLPETAIDEAFWCAFPRFYCFFGRACAWYGQCQGLSEAYIERFGWEVGRLRPRERSQAANVDAAPNGEPAAGPAGSRWLELLRGPGGEPLERTSLWSLETVTKRGREVRYRFLLPNGDRYELVLAPRDDGCRRHAQTAGFNVTLVPVGATRPRLINRLLFTLLPIVSRNDDGRLRLD